MGHCGNGHHVEGSDQNLYSLRSPDPHNEGRWISHVTLVMNSMRSRVTGEIKGYANQKPAGYGEYMVPFIEKFVDVMAGGGYKPQNNFKIGDLTHEQQLSIYHNKPSVLRAHEEWRVNGGILDDSVLNKINSETPFGYMTEDQHGNDAFIIDEGEGFSNMAAALGQNDFKMINEHFQALCGLSVTEEWTDGQYELKRALGLLLADSQGRKDAFTLYAEKVCGIAADSTFVDRVAEDISSLEQGSSKLASIVYQAMSFGYKEGEVALRRDEASRIADEAMAAIPGLVIEMNLDTQSWEFKMAAEDILVLNQKFNDMGISTGDDFGSIISYFSDNGLEHDGSLVSQFDANKLKDIPFDVSLARRSLLENSANRMRALVKQEREQGQAFGM